MATSSSSSVAKRALHASLGYAARFGAVVERFDDFVAAFDELLEDLEELHEDQRLLQAHAALKIMEDSLKHHLDRQDGLDSDQLEALYLKRCATLPSALNFHYGARGNVVFRRDIMEGHATRFAQLKADVALAEALLHGLEADGTTAASPGRLSSRLFTFCSLLGSPPAGEEPIVDVSAAVGDVWQCVYAHREGDDELRVSYKHTRGTTVYAVKLDGVMSVDLERLLALVFEVDLYPRWLPSLLGVGLKGARELALLDRLRKLAYLDFALPWPLPNVDIAVEGFGVDALDLDRRLLVLLRHLHEHPSTEVPSVPRGYRRVLLRHGGAVLQPLDLKRTRLTAVAEADAQVAVPDWFLSFGLKTFAGLIWRVCPLSF